MVGLLDTDIVFKSAIYRLIGDLNKAPPAPVEALAILAATRFVVKKKLKHKLANETAKSAIQELDLLLENVELIEPTEQETAIAETLELLAAKANLSLDIGESQLCAILIARGLKAIFTGDKRAILAMEELNSSGEFAGAFSAKVACFEQVVVGILNNTSFETVRLGVCDNCGTDKALELCFACSSAAASAESTREGLHSYIRHLQSSAPSVMI